MLLREILLYFQVIKTVLLRQFTLKKACYENILGRHCFLKGKICLSVHQEVELSYFSCGLWKFNGWKKCYESISLEYLYYPINNS